MFSAASKTGSQPAATAATYIEDVFSTYLYTGNGTTQTITNNLPFIYPPVGGNQNFFPTNSYSELSTGSTMNFGTSDWTIEFFYQGSPNTYGVFFEIFNGIAGQRISIQRNSSGADAIYVEGGAIVLITSGGTPWDGSWHHHAIVRNVNTVTYYIDGVSRGTYTTSLNLTGTASVRIGNYSQSTAYAINGYLSNLRVVTGTAVYTSTFTPPTSALTAISGTQLLTCQSPAPFVDNSSNAFTITAFNGASSSTSGPFTNPVPAKGGLVWLKDRDVASNNLLFDTVRGANNGLYTNDTGIQYNFGPTGPFSPYGGVGSFNSDGFYLNGPGYTTNYVNYSGHNNVSWSFIKQAKFFDIVTYTGTGSARTISHNLGATPGMIIVKRIDSTGNWQVYHRSLTSAAYAIQLNLGNTEASDTTVWNSTAPTSSVFSVGTNTDVNQSGGTYVAYLYAHNAGGFGTSGTDNVISCGTYTGTGTSPGPTIDLGFEPQFLLIKNIDASPRSWFLHDVMRGMSLTNSLYLQANSNTSENDATQPVVYPTATGFVPYLASSGWNGAGQRYIYMAIRRPMKVPTDATTVFSPTYSSALTGTPITVGFPIDLQMDAYTGSDARNTNFNTRLIGSSSNSTYYSNFLISSSTSAEQSYTGIYWVGSQNWNNTSFDIPGFYSSAPTRYYSFSRRPGFFDVVCTSVFDDGIPVTHNLGVTPELILVKTRSSASSWMGAVNDAGNIRNISINTTSGGYLPGLTYSSYFNSTTINPTGIRNGAGGAAKGTTLPVVIYLFASCPGVSKVGSYTGTGATQTINCGFTGGARFVLIKRTDSTGAWYVWDTARGMVSGTDPSLQLNSAAAEVNANSVYTATTGFSLLASPSADVNTSGGNYIYLAIA